MRRPQFYLPPYLKALTVMMFIIVLVFFLIVGKSLLVPLFMGGFFAVLLTPLGNFLEKYRVPRTISCILCLLAMIAIVAGLVAFIVSNVSNFVKDFSNVSERLLTVAGQFDNWTKSTFGIDENIAGSIDSDAIYQYFNKNSSSISAFALNAIGSMSGLVLIPIFMFFQLLYRDHLTKMMVMIYRDKDSALVKMRISNLRKLIQNYIVGVGKVMVILAVLNIIAYSIIGVKHAVFFGVIGAILNIIPYVGPLIGVSLPMIYSFLTMENPLIPVLIFGCYQLIQLIEGNVLTPKIVGGNVNLNAFTTFLGLLVGASIWGIAGMILVIPTLAIMREIFSLSEHTKPFALLLGEEKDDDGYITPKEEEKEVT